jgi:hypothetical protein
MIFLRNHQAGDGVAAVAEEAIPKRPAIAD